MKLYDQKIRGEKPAAKPKQETSHETKKVRTERDDVGVLELPAPDSASGQGSEPSGATTYKYRDRAKRRAYLRDYMREYQRKARAARSQTG